MKAGNKNRPLLVFAGAAALCAVVWFVLILPHKGTIDKDMRVLSAKRKKISALAGENGRGYEEVRKALISGRTEVVRKRDGLLAALTFTLDDDFDADNHLQPEVDFPIVRNKVIAFIRDNYPGFPFDSSLGFPELPHGDKDVFRDLYIRLAVCRRLLEIFGESEIDAVTSFRHEPSVEEHLEQAAMRVERKVVTVSFEGGIHAIYDALRKLSTPGKYLKIESLSIHPSRSGYSLACDLSVSILIFTFEGEEGAPPEHVTPPSPSPGPRASVSPSPSPSARPVSTPAASKAPAPKTTTTRKNPLGF